MPSDHVCPGEHVYDDITYMHIVPKDALEAVKEMEFRSDDTVLVTYPKAGTTWLSQIACLLLKQGEIVNIRMAVPIVEFSLPGQPHKAVSSATMPSPRILATHLQPQFFDDALQKYSPRMIVLMRNPKDCLVSYYHFYRANEALGKFPGSFSDYFELYLDDKIVFGDPIKHMAAWWKKYRDDPRFLFTTYEEMKKNPHDEIRRIADFLKVPVTDDKVSEIVDKSSFEKMSKDPSVNKERDPTHDSKVSKYLRKGAVGDWVSVFTKEQSDSIDKRCREELEPLGLVFDC